MSYGKVNKLLTQDGETLSDVVLIESPFVETSRLGTPMRSVLLALTSKALVIVRKIKNNRERICYEPLNESQMLEVRSRHSLHKIKLKIFKRSRRQVLKLTCNHKVEKYFELGICKKRKIFWDIWTNLIDELNRGSKVWPFTKGAYGKSIRNYHFNTLTDIAESPQIELPLKEPIKWNDKYLYLGSKREAEDKVRPIPIPGLGKTDEIKLLYLKSQYFGCMDQAEHWVQCGQSISDATYAYKIYTYTGKPTSNITYDSIMTSWK